jgi:hypothetical protein
MEHYLSELTHEAPEARRARAKDLRIFSRKLVASDFLPDAALQGQQLNQPKT